MAVLDDTAVVSDPAGLHVVHPAGRRTITHAFHDVDGTHTLIRDWPPVMSVTVHWAMTGGLEEDFDSEENRRRLVQAAGRQPLVETDRFCVESAGLSALTQMEFGIRRAIELGNLPASAGPRLTDEDRTRNSTIIARIWAGEEQFDDENEPAALRRFIAERTPRLFRLYEDVLNDVCRDRNTAAARRDPGAWRVPGSLEFLCRLHAYGCVNYFVTGAVLYESGGMLEEIGAVGFELGPGCMVEGIEGSDWNRKRPKDDVMRELAARLNVPGEQVLVIGDGRSEIRAGVRMGAVTLSRLPPGAKRQREIHQTLGTNYIVPDFLSSALKKLIRAEA